MSAESLVSFNLLIFNFYEEVLEEWQFESKSDGCVREETCGYCCSQDCKVKVIPQQAEVVWGVPVA